MLLLRQDVISRRLRFIAMRLAMAQQRTGITVKVTAAVSMALPTERAFVHYP